MRIEQPIQWLGGRLATLWKVRGSMAYITNHRDITITCVGANQYASHTRAGLFSPPRHIVGRSSLTQASNGGACDIAHLHISGAIAYGMQQNKYAATVFFDLFAAYASLTRSVAVPLDDAVDNEQLGYLAGIVFSYAEAATIMALACDTLR